MKKTHVVDRDYAAVVAKRFGQWVLDSARATYDQAWLDYQYEIGLRHHRSKKIKPIMRTQLVTLVPAMCCTMHS